MENKTAFRPGDIFSTPGEGFSGWVSEKFTIPHTSRFHFGLLSNRITCGDWEIRESISKGPAVNRLFLDYYKYDIEIYRVVGAPDAQAAIAAEALSEIGEEPYGWRDLIKLGYDAVSLMIQGKWPPYRPEQLNLSHGNSYLCTEAANYGYTRAGIPLCKGAAIPSAFKQAEIESRLVLIYKGNLTDIAPSELIQKYKAEGLMK